MKKINSIKFIDSLAEITSFRDRKVIERSLLKTLLEFQSDSSFRLYQVLHSEPELKLGMLSYASKKNIINAEDINQHKLPSKFSEPLLDVINSGKIVTIKPTSNEASTHSLYPAFNANHEIFAILIQTTNISLSYEVQRFVHGFLRIYSNYLEMIELTKRDKLTGLLNRETLESEITRILINNNLHGDLQDIEEREVQRDDERRHKGPTTYWLSVLDIDHFKSINDNYGHIYGDEILILVARLLEKSVREFDKIFRYGGEEFVILIKSFDATEAAHAFERIRKVIESHQYAKIETLTVCIGGTQITNQTDPNNVIEAADMALYYAKQNGRNQSHLYETLLAEGKISAVYDNINDSEIDFF
ncbi:MAG: GGDEF domain-containing protein [Psychromonas sp.]|nr:GGDEF domain-containing protein [Psychromonas sp.]